MPTTGHMPSKAPEGSLQASTPWGRPEGASWEAALPVHSGSLALKPYNPHFGLLREWQAGRERGGASGKGHPEHRFQVERDCYWDLPAVPSFPMQGGREGGGSAQLPSSRATGGGVPRSPFSRASDACRPRWPGGGDGLAVGGLQAAPPRVFLALVHDSGSPRPSPPRNKRSAQRLPSLPPRLAL